MFYILHCIYFWNGAETVSYNGKFITKSSRGGTKEKDMEETERKLMVKQEFKQKERQKAENTNKWKMKRNTLDCNICFLTSEWGQEISVQ